MGLEFPRSQIHTTMQKDKWEYCIIYYPPPAHPHSPTNPFSHNSPTEIGVRVGLPMNCVYRVE